MTRPGTLTRVWETILSSLATCLCVTILGVVVLIAGAPLLLQAERFYITTNSMLPHYAPGTLVIVQPVDPPTLQIGDTVSFHASWLKGAVITHRIVGLQKHSREGLRVITKGDNNAVADVAPVDPAEIIGVVRYAVPVLGLFSHLYENEVFKYAAPVASVLLLLWAVTPRLQAQAQAQAKAEAMAPATVIANPTVKSQA